MTILTVSVLSYLEGGRTNHLQNSKLPLFTAIECYVSKGAIDSRTFRASR